MNQKQLSMSLKTIIAGVGIMGLILYGYFLPFAIGQDYFVARYPEFAHYYVPWVVFLSLSAVPCYLVLIRAWRIATQIDHNNSFSHINAKHMQRISLYVIIDSAYLFIGSIVLLLMNMNHPGIVIGLSVISLIGCMISVAAACLARLIEKAALIKDENDSII